MKKITLSLYEIMTLDLELNGLINQQTKERVVPGLLSEKLPMVTRYWLNILNQTVSSEKTILDGLRNDLIKKYGVEDGNGNWTIPFTVDDKDQDGNTIPVEENGKTVNKQVKNPAYESWEKDFNELMNTEKELEVHLFDIEKDFKDLSTDKNYTVIFKLVKQPE